MKVKSNISDRNESYRWRRLLC